MNRIRTISLMLRTLCQIACVALPILMVWFWLQAPKPLWTLPGLPAPEYSATFIPNSIQILHQLSGMTKLYGFLISCIPNGIILINLYILIKLSSNFANGELFSLVNFKYIRNIGIIMLVGQFLHLIYHALMSLVMTFHNPPGSRIMEVTVTPLNIGVVVIAIAVILISWIISEGYKIQEEQRLTI